MNEIEPVAFASQTTYPITDCQFQSEAGMLGLLARLWIAEIDAPLLEMLRKGELHEPYTAAGGFVPEISPEDMIETLAIEFCGCFLGPKHHLPPYQSIVDSSRFQSDTVDSMKTWFGLLGKPLGLFSGIQMSDHAGVQLHMQQTISSAISLSVDLEERESLLHMRSTFYQQHVAWIKEYCELAGRKTASQFYKSLFNMTANFLRLVESSESSNS